MRDFSAVSNINDNYKKMGIDARLHVRIPDLGLELNQGIGSAGTITRQIKPFGGLEQVSTLRISNLELSEELKFCTEASLNAKPQGAIRGAGRLISIGNYAESYNDVRNATSADEFMWPTITVGQSYDAGTNKYYNYRGFMQFSVPSGITSCEEATIFLQGINTYLTSSTNINLILVAGTWSSLGSYGIGNTAIFNDFTGWQATGAYTDYITQLNIAWSTAEFITYSASLPVNEQSNHLRLNAAGLAAIVAATGGTIKFMLLSENDVTNTAPTGNEFVQFNAESVTLELRYNTKKLKNRTAYVYRYYGTEPSSYTGMAELYRGRIDNFSIDNKELELDLVKSDVVQNPIIPKNIITDDDFTNCPEENLGKPYPITYGDIWQGTRTHKIGIGSEYSGSSINPLSGVRDYFPFPVVDFGDFDHDTPMKILIAKTALKDTINGFPAFYSSGMKGFSRFWANISSDKGSGYSYIEATPKSHPNQSNSDVYPTEVNAYNIDFFGEGTSIIPSSVYSSVNFTNPENAYSAADVALFSESTSWAQYAFPSISSSGEIKKVEVSFYLTDNNTDPAIDLILKVLEKPAQSRDIERSDGITTNIDSSTSNFSRAVGNWGGIGVTAGDMLVITTGDNEGRYRIKSVPDTSNLRTEKQPDEAETGQTFHILAAGSVLKTVTSIYNTGTRIINITDLDSGKMDWDLSSKLIQIEVSAFASPVLDYEISCLQVRYFSTPERITTVYLDSQGVADDGSGTITGENSALIENPSHIIESLARDEIGMAAAEIDTTALDTLATDLPSWILAFQLTEQQEVNNILDGIGEQCRTIIYRDEENKLTAKAWDTTDFFPHSGTNTPGDLDIFQESCSPAADGTGNEIMTRNPIMDFTLEQINPADVKNSFVLNYKKNYATSGYEGTITMDNGDGTVGSVGTSLIAGDEAYMENSQTIIGLETLCAGSYTNCDSTTQTLKIDADYIRDRATAVKLFQHLIETRAPIRHVATIRTRENPALWVENGDMINIRHRRIYEYCGIPTAQKKKWLVYRNDHSLGDGQILLKAIEVNLVA